MYSIEKLLKQKASFGIIDTNTTGLLLINWLPKAKGFT